LASSIAGAVDWDGKLLSDRVPGSGWHGWAGATLPECPQIWRGPQYCTEVVTTLSSYCISRLCVCVCLSWWGETYWYISSHNYI